MKPETGKKLLKIAIPLLLGVFLIWYSYSRFSPEQLQEITEHFRSANYGYIVLAMVLGLLSNLSRALRWNCLLHPLGYRTRFGNNLMAVYTGYLMNMFIPRGGELIRAGVLSRYEQVPFDRSLGTVVSERVVDMVIMLAFTALAFILNYDILVAYLSDTGNPTRIIYFAGALILAGGLLFAFLKFSGSALREKIISFLSGVWQGINSLFIMKNQWAFWLHTVFIWVMYVLMFYVCFFALPDTASASFPVVLTGFVIGGLVVTLTNSGFGTYPFALAGVLALFGIPETAGTAFGWIVWSSQMIVFVVLGGLSFILLPVVNRN